MFIPRGVGMVDGGLYISWLDSWRTSECNMYRPFFWQNDWTHPPCQQSCYSHACVKTLGTGKETKTNKKTKTRTKTKKKWKNDWDIPPCQQSCYSHACVKTLGTGKEPRTDTNTKKKAKKTLQELLMLSSVTLNCQVTKSVMNSGSQLSEL